MAWSAIEGAFESGQADAVIAGADSPNTASLALMRRLGMQFHRNVTYPLGSGAEYILHRDCAGPIPRPESILVNGAVSLIPVNPMLKVRSVLVSGQQYG
jgi:hypothetical protein